jgi:hypothetical protein
MDSFSNGTMRMRSTIEGILSRGNYIRMIDGRYADGFVDLKVLRAIIKDGGAELFNHHGVKTARRSTKVKSRKVSHHVGRRAVREKVIHEEKRNEILAGDEDRGRGRVG